MQLQLQQLSRATGCGAATELLWLRFINQAMARFQINTCQRVAMFLAQVGHESASLTRLVENLNYSAQGLANTWPGRFAMDPKAGTKEPTALANQLARKPELIANAVYGGRMGNGAPPTGDGWRYRGRGLIMITGRENYRRAGAALGVDLEARPELLEDREWAALAAAWYWAVNGLNELADDGRFERITVKINGGLIGIDDRRARLSRSTAALS